MINENKLIEYMRKQNITNFEDGEEVSIDGIIERFKEEEFLKLLEEEGFKDEEVLNCEVCFKSKSCVRFEGSFEGFICDECLDKNEKI